MSKLKKIFAHISLLAAMWLAFISVAAPLAFAQSPQLTSNGGSYDIRLNSAADFAKLLDFGKNIRHIVFGNSSSQFKNIYTFDSTYSQDKLEKRLAGSFIYLEPLAKIQSAGVVVNYPGFTTNSQDVDKQWGLVKAGFDQGWQKTTGSLNNVVAVVDTGIDETHQDLKTISFVRDLILSVSR